MEDKNLGGEMDKLLVGKKIKFLFNSIDYIMRKKEFWYEVTIVKARQTKKGLIFYTNHEGHLSIISASDVVKFEVLN